MQLRLISKLQYETHFTQLDNIEILPSFWIASDISDWIGSVQPPLSFCFIWYIDEYGSITLYFQNSVAISTL